jgi:hypothetical protein
MLKELEDDRTIKMRQKINSPVEPMAGLEETREQQRVAPMIMASSTPYIRRRPNTLGRERLVKKV